MFSSFVDQLQQHQKQCKALYHSVLFESRFFNCPIQEEHKGKGQWNVLHVQDTFSHTVFSKLVVANGSFF
jgi:hypothetical protein